MRVHRSSLIPLVLTLFVFSTGDAVAANWTVRPDGTGDFPTIQAALNGAATGDVIFLTDGVFQGAGNRDLNPQGKNVTIRSQGGDARNCVIDMQRQGRAFTMNNGENSEMLIQEITMRGGYQYTGGVVMVSLASPTFLRCIFEDNEAGEGGVFYT